MAHELEQNYSGDSTLFRFVDVFRKLWDECMSKDELLNK